MKIKMIKRASAWLAALLVLPALLGVLGGCAKQPLEFTVAEGGLGRLVSKCDPYAEEIVIPEKYRGLPVVGIAHGAFSGCAKMKSVSIPETVTVIGDDAFYGCSGLEELVLPAGVTELGAGAFTNCKKLKTFTVPEGVTVLPDALFMGNVDLGTVVIPEGVTELGDKVFYNCQSLTDVKLPETLTTIGDSVFVDCKALAEITFPDSLVNMGVGPLAGTAYAEKAESKDGHATVCGKWVLDIDSEVSGEYVLPEGYQHIAAFAFSGCAGITSLVLPEGVTDAGRSAFAECHALKSVTLPSTLKVLPAYAFYKDDELTEIDLGGVTAISANAFASCKMLQQVTIPAGVRRIEGGAFSRGVGLVGVTFAEPSGWRVRADEGAAAGQLTAELLSDPTRAASLLAYDYNGYLWERN